MGYGLAPIIGRRCVMTLEADQRRQIKLQAQEIEGLIGALQIEKIVNGLLREDVKKLQEELDGVDSKE